MDVLLMIYQRPWISSSNNLRNKLLISDYLSSLYHSSHIILPSPSLAYPILLYPILSCRIVFYAILSHPIVSYHIISHHIISIISYHMASSIKTIPYRSYPLTAPSHYLPLHCTSVPYFTLPSPSSPPSSLLLPFPHPLSILYLYFIFFSSLLSSLLIISVPTIPCLPSYLL